MSYSITSILLIILCIEYVILHTIILHTITFQYFAAKMKLEYYIFHNIIKKFKA